MNYDYLVYPYFSDENFSSACQMVESMIPGIKKTGSLSTVDGPIQNYSFDKSFISVYGKIRDNEVSISSSEKIKFLQTRVIGI